MDKPWKVISAFVGVFIAGAVFGGVFTLRASAKRAASEPAKSLPAEVAVVTPPPVKTGETPPAKVREKENKRKELQAGGITAALMRRLTQRLNPTPEQRAKIRVVVDRAADDFQRIQRDQLMETERVSKRMYEDVSEVLTPEQRVQLERMKQETLERARKERERQRQESQFKAAGKAAPAGPPIQSRQQGP